MSVKKASKASKSKSDLYVRMPAAWARKQLPELLNRVAYGRECILIEKHGKPMAALVPLDAPDLVKLLQALEELRKKSQTLK